MVVLGINGVADIFHDASATLLIDGKIVASVEEERFNREKHSNGIPFLAIEYCLGKAGISVHDVDHIGFYLDPDVLKQTFYTDIIAKYGCDPVGIGYYAQAADRIRAVPQDLAARFGPFTKSQFHFINHHLAHASSSFHISGFERSAVLTVDGSGDRESSALYRGGPTGPIEKVHEFLVYPESLGFIYTVIAAHLGLGWLTGPGKMMGLAAYGKADESLFDDIIVHRSDPRRPIEIDLSFFNYHTGGSGLTSKGLERFGEARPDGSPVEDAEQADLAASMQRALERAVMHIVRSIPEILPERRLCFSGGVALNVLINRQIKDCGLFEDVFVTPPAYDSGTSLGCALHLDALYSGRAQYAFDVYSGPDIARDFDIAAACTEFGERIEWAKLDEDALVERAAGALAENKFIGWVQGRMECGPRALGNRSILGNAMDPAAKDRLNRRVKHREPFRPYAPSVLQSECAKWFDLEESPYMLLEAQVLPEKRSQVAGIVHVDNSARPQSVTAQSNPRYFKLLSKFFEKTGVPLVLNTSFNRHGEPIVNRPQEAIQVLLETELDELFVGDYHIRRRP